MRLLILGGTAWLGSHVARAALRLGHEVTCLARGASGPEPADARFVQTDRDRPNAYEQVVRRKWDAVVDVSRQPGQVRDAAMALRDCSSSFVFVSSSNVYCNTSVLGEDESAPLLSPLEGEVMETMESYGNAKVACEQHVLNAFGANRSFIARSGLIGGPGDIFDRTGYWPLRFTRPAAKDGTVLIPDVPGLMTQVLDVRDLADWIVAGASRRLSGVFNANGMPIPMARHLELAREVAGHSGAMASVDQEWLVAHAVNPWMGPRSMPLWVPMPEYAGFNSRDSSAARAAGLVTRPLKATLEDVLAWELRRDSSTPRRAGLSDQDERELLDQITASSPVGFRIGP